ncbi:P-loop containing nucleoside triphosphate hydrolase protein [Artomyces pyxidatus]|uniref:P-loop containing nucleoside triphosphate hydrolase protein n=1 Tax=Artomyces pyxidatus TaxID=48021 RepID=A0ACB8TK74_9AGAM|nr:P-loop containing nucleoside triphosphate hydrolase protein [Artomyces pyxidatus]
MKFLRCLKLSRSSPSLQPRAHRRYIASTRHDPSSTRNLAVVAHIDSGKTTLTESILLKSHYISSSGSVDTGSTTTDFLPAERERGITIQSASIPVKWKDWTFNLIDTPGHADFGMEVESASRVVDGAIVLIDSVEGVEAQTKGVWSQLNRYGVPTRIMFMNKLDRPGASFHSSVLSTLSHRIHPRPTVLTLPVASFTADDYSRAESGIQGIVDLVKWELWKWSSDGVSSRHPLPTDVQVLQESELFPPSHPLLAHLPVARAELVENLSMTSEELMEYVLDLPSTPSAYLAVPAPVLLPHLRAATLRSDILPVLCGSALEHIGTEILMDYAGELLANPLDVPHDDQSSKSPIRLLAWKVAWDKKKGWMTFVRVYSGTVTRQSVLLNSTRNTKERVSKLILLYASEAEEVEELPFGSVGVILGLKHTRTGDTLTSTKGTIETSSLAKIIPPPAVMSASVIPQSHADLEPVEQALMALTRTDPSVRVETQEGQLLVHGLGALHLEIVEGRLRDEWNVNFEFGKRRVSFRESLGPLTSGSPPQDTWTATVGGKSVTTAVTFTLRPLEDDEAGDPLWDGNVVVWSDGRALPSPDTLQDTHNPITHVARGIASTLSNSPHTALPLSRLHIAVSSFTCPPDVPASVLAGASAVILRNNLRARAMGPLMEPFVQLRISVGEEVLGKVVKDVTEHGGEVLDLAGSNVSIDGEAALAYSDDGVYIPPKWLSPSTMSWAKSADTHALRQRRSVTAVAPLSRMLDYSTRLRALSGGHGQFEMTGAGFRLVNQARQQEILREIGRA